MMKLTFLVPKLVTDSSPHAPYTLPTSSVLLMGVLGNTRGGIMLSHAPESNAALTVSLAATNCLFLRWSLLICMFIAFLLVPLI